MDKKKIGKKVMGYVLMTLACFCYAVGISLFVEPNNIASGGVTGIAIILNKAIGGSTGIWFFVINIPILLIGMWKFGFKFLMSTVYCTTIISVFTDLLSRYGSPLTNDVLVATIAGGMLTAIGMGGVFKAGATTGGMDIVVKLCKLKFPYMKTGSLFLIMDFLVVLASAFVFQDIDRAFYSAMEVFVTSTLLDMVLYGRDGAKLIYIISDKSEKIAARLLDELNIGVTYMEGQGAYSGREKKVIMCVTKKQIAPRAEEIVKEEDPNTFMIVSSASEIYGEGYKSYFSEKL
ncbi:MAG: YitT family protein [Lachnospiraceae bacterium]|nr:YitT family protein [Lachnospiraceae bacterium]